MSDLNVHFGQPIGKVLAVSGSQTTVALNPEATGVSAVRIGAIVKVTGERYDVVGTISAIQSEPGDRNLRVVALDLLGELVPAENGGIRFRRGVSLYPVTGATACCAGEAELGAIYAPPSVPHVRVGALYDDPARPAMVLSDDLLGKHFAVLGASGSGKSCSVALILSRILDAHPNAHMILLDPHNEYAAAFGDLAENVNVDNIHFPLWLLNFEEASEVLISSGTPEEKEAQSLILHNIILRARREFAAKTASAHTQAEQKDGAPSFILKAPKRPEPDPDDDLSMITVDTPVPYATSELLRLIDDALGSAERPDRPGPYLRLKARIEALRADPQFAFMFADLLTVRDTLAQLIGRLLRFPVAGRPITTVDLSAVPSDIADVLVSLLCRLVFDFALWSGQGQMPPVMLVCEEAHRYVPADPTIGFAATARSIGRIAKEGRKYGISLALVTQRPSELSPTAISQCGTVFAMRLPADLDQRFMSAALPEAGRGMLAALPSLATQEAVICGQGVPLPMRIRFDDLPAERRPRSSSGHFSEAWLSDSAGLQFVRDSVRRWRLQRRETVPPRQPTDFPTARVA